MRAIGLLGSVSLVMVTWLLTDAADAASNPMQCNNGEGLTRILKWDGPHFL
jgi:hypothetical protein